MGVCERLAPDRILTPFLLKVASGILEALDKLEKSTKLLSLNHLCKSFKLKVIRLDLILLRRPFPFKKGNLLIQPFLILVPSKVKGTLFLAFLPLAPRIVVCPPFLEP